MNSHEFGVLGAKLISINTCSNKKLTCGGLWNQFGDPVFLNKSMLNLLDF